MEQNDGVVRKRSIKMSVAISVLKNIPKLSYTFGIITEFLAGVGAGTLMGLSLNSSVWMGITWAILGMVIPISVKILLNALLKMKPKEHGA